MGGHVVLITQAKSHVGHRPLLVLILFGLFVSVVLGQPGEIQVVKLLERARLAKVLQKDVSDTSVVKLVPSMKEILLLTNNVDLEELNNMDIYAESNVSMACANHTLEYSNALSRGEQWAMRMFDATAKISSGILDGNMFWFGSYDECFSALSGSNASIPVDVEPNYCLISATILKILPIYFGMCLPRVCSNSDVVALLKAGLSMVPYVNEEVTVTSVNCQQEMDIWQDNRAVIVIACYSVLGALLLVGTLYDIIRTMIQSWRGVDGTCYTDDVLQVESYSKAKPPTTEETPLITNVSVPCDKVISERPAGTTGMCGRLLLSFSLYTNSAKVLNTEQSTGTLTSLHGVRFLSMTWVILGHTFALGAGYTANGSAVYEMFLSRWTFQVVMQGTFSVDSFFLLSGTLVAYLTLTEMAKVNGRINWIYYYIHRVWRLTPAYMLILGLYVTMFKYWGDGPGWLGSEWTDTDNCKDVWWTNLLYLNNLISVDKMCMGWTWYLANDMQFYVISPILLLPLFFFPLAGAVLLVAMMAATFTATAVITRQDNLGPGIIGDTTVIEAKYFQDMYIKPWCRIGPYLVGVVLGYVMYRTKCCVRMNKLLVLLLWGVAAVLCLAPLYGLYDHANGEPLSLSVAALYNALARTSWALGLAWLMFACCTGYGGIINTLLSWKALVPLSRLTYCAYLVHPIIMVAVDRRARQPFYVSDATIICRFLAYLVLSYAVAFVASIAFESPMMVLEKTIRTRNTLNRDK